MMTPTPEDRMRDLGPALKAAGEAFAKFAPAISAATLGLRNIPPPVPPPGPCRRTIDRLDWWAGRYCDRPGCNQVECRAARARRKATRR